MVKTKCILLSHTSLALSAFKYFKTVCRILSAFNQRKLKKSVLLLKKTARSTNQLIVGITNVLLKML